MDSGRHLLGSRRVRSGEIKYDHVPYVIAGLPFLELLRLYGVEGMGVFWTNTLQGDGGALVSERERLLQPVRQ